MAGIVVVFDFDKTIIDCDSDNWVVDDLGAAKRFDELLQTMPWNSAIDMMMGELYSQGKSMEDVSNSLKSAPLHAKAISTIKSACDLGCDLKILSDANLYYIETILRHHGLMGYFSEIITNPGFVDEEGRLRIFPYHDFNTSSHGCTLCPPNSVGCSICRPNSVGCSICPPNMCKGIILERMRESEMAKGKKKFIYLGDGRGDYCPSLKLSADDYVMPRKGFPLWELICANTKALRAEVHEWSDFEEQETVLLQLIHKAISVDHDEGSLLLSMDCKLQNMPKAGHDALSQALPAPN